MRLHNYLTRKFILACAITSLITAVANASLTQKTDKVVGGDFSTSPAASEISECGRATLALEPVPAPEAPPEVSVLRHEQRLRFLAVIGLNQSDYAAPYQRIARRCGASLDVLVSPTSTTPYDYLVAHTCDNWDEYDKKTIPSFIITDEVEKIRPDVLAKGYDVIFCSQLLTELVSYMEQGGVWVVCGNIYPDSNSSLASLWPAKPSPNRSWHSNGAQRTDAPELAGLPLNRLSAWAWIPLAEPTVGAQALATGETGATFIRPIGKGTLVFVPTGPISRTHNAIERFQRAYDHDDIWLRYWDQLLYSLIAGEQALPVLADMQLKGEETTPGGYILPGKLINRTATAQTVSVSVRIVSPLGKTVYESAPQDVSLEPGETKAWEPHVLVGTEWGSGLYAAYMAIDDPVTGKQIHEALDFIPVAGSVKLELTSDKSGYQLNEDANFNLKASAPTWTQNPWQGEVRWGVYDFRGRLLGSGSQVASLGPQMQTIPFTWTFADHGVRVDAVWVIATAVNDGLEWGRAECKIYKHERWNMRNEYQWSTWAPIACQPPCLVPQSMQLMAHAGLNALGYPGANELYYAAERWGWRMYNEGVGTNTWNPVIESVTDEEIAAAQKATYPYSLSGPDLNSGALVIASVGEEAGYKYGWGTTYYWGGPVAPDKACQAFQRFLQEHYSTLATLNAAWGTCYQAWDEIKLTKEFSGQVPTMGADGLVHPTESPIGAGSPGVTLAPYQETQQFYFWYYNKIIEAALDFLHEQVNPVPLAVVSAPAGWIFESPLCDVRLAVKDGRWQDSQWFSVETNGREPAFTLNWGHFDDPKVTENLFWHYVITRTGHNDYWVDIPLMFNPDMSHTRASFAIRRWRERTAHAERLLLDAVPIASEAGVLGPTGGFIETAEQMADRIRISLNQGGFGFADADPQDLNRYKIVFAVFHNSVSMVEAEALAAYAEGGGTLVFTQRFAGLDENGVPQTTVPGLGLAEKWGLTVTGKNDAIPQYLLGKDAETLNAPLDSLGPLFKDLLLTGYKIFIEQINPSKWDTWLTYSDGTPAMLSRDIGTKGGKLVYLNVAYRPQYRPNYDLLTDKACQGFYRVIEMLCEDAHVHRTFSIDDDLAQTLHLATVQWTDPSGQIAYVATRTNGEVQPWVNGTLTWLGPQPVCYDVYGGDISQPAPVYGKAVTLQLQPGAGRLLAFTPAEVNSVNVSVATTNLLAGQPLQVRVDILDAAGMPVAGKFPVHLQVTRKTGEITGLRRDLSLASGESVMIQTALNDPAGFCTVTVCDSISRLTGTATVDIMEATEATLAPAFQPWGQPSENWEPERLPVTEFIDKLKQLADVYRNDHSGENWLAKQWLGAYYCLFPGTRHDIVRTLTTVDWLNYADTLKDAVESGENLILVGEDLGLDPATGMTVWPEGDCRQIEAVAAAMAGAMWDTISSDGEIVRAHLGNGSLVLCRNTPDGIGHTWGDAVAWQKLLLTALNNGQGTPFAAPDATKLRRWLAGQEALVTGPLTAEWQGEWKQTIDPQTDLIGPVFVLRLPPIGEVIDIAFNVTVRGVVKIDVGADGSIEAEAKSDRAVATPWANTIADYLAWRENVCGGVERDLNGWRLVPIRFVASGRDEVTVHSTKVVSAVVTQP
jgi:hypothetical protein